MHAPKRPYSSEAGPSRRVVSRTGSPASRPPTSRPPSSSRQPTPTDSLAGHGQRSVRRYDSNRSTTSSPSSVTLRGDLPAQHGVLSGRVHLPGREQSVAATTEPPSDDFGGDDDDTAQEVVMAVNVTERGSVGCAYYVAREHKLYFMEDAQLGGADIVDLR